MRAPHIMQPVVGRDTLSAAIWGLKSEQVHTLGTLGLGQPLQTVLGLAAAAALPLSPAAKGARAAGPTSVTEWGASRASPSSSEAQRDSGGLSGRL